MGEHTLKRVPPDKSSAASIMMPASLFIKEQDTRAFYAKGRTE